MPSFRRSTIIALKFLDWATAVIIPGTSSWQLRDCERIIPGNEGLLGRKHFLVGITRLRNEALIRLTDDSHARFAETAPEGYLTMYQTMRLLGVSRQTVWQRVKRGEIEAVHVKRGRQKGLRLKLIRSQPEPLQSSLINRGAV